MKVLEFRKIRKDDLYDLKYNWWSRIYEYPLVIESIDKYMDNNNNNNNNNNIKIHNTSWGFEGVHITFKNDLEKKYNEVVNSDIKESQELNTIIWDITNKPMGNHINYFDVVINVSTVEEVKSDHVNILKNLIAQIKDGGLLIITFDLPGLDLDNVEKFLGVKLETHDDDVNGANSKLKNNKYGHLTCGLLVLRK
jgi:SAM-dependent methyltransferase